MDVTYANHTEIIDTDANNSVTVTPPASIASGDIWLIWASVDSDGAGLVINTPSGFTPIGSQWDDGDGWLENRLCYKVAGASESNVTLTVTGADYDAVVYSIRIVGSEGTPVLDATGTPTRPSGNGTTLDAPDITIGADGSLALLFAAAGSTSWTKPTGTDNIRDSRTGAYPSTAWTTQSVNAGSYAPGNWTLSDNRDGRSAQTISFRPAAAASGNPYYAYAQQ